jgi:hypothetical protein
MSPSSAQSRPQTAGENGKSTAESSSTRDQGPDSPRPRRTTHAPQSSVEETILHPGTVRINVQGAFIVNDEPSTPRGEDYEHDTRDIRLPNHTAVVSHIAVDVSVSEDPERILGMRLQNTTVTPGMEASKLTRLWCIDRRLPCQTRLLLPRT